MTRDTDSPDVSVHYIDGREYVQALAEYVARRDGLTLVHGMQAWASTTMSGPVLVLEDGIKVASVVLRLSRGPTPEGLADVEGRVVLRLIPWGLR